MDFLMNSLGVVLENIILCLWKIFLLKLQEALPAGKACVSLMRGHGVKKRTKMMCFQRREIAGEEPGSHATLFLGI